MQRIREIFKSLFTPSAWDIVGWLKASPIVVAGMTAAAGYLQNLPWMYILVGTLLSFMSVGVGLVAFRVLRHLMDPEHKLAFVRPMVTRGGVEAAAIGGEIRNDGTFPIEVRIETLRTSIAGRTTAPNRGLLNRQFVLSPGDKTEYRDAVIDLTGITTPMLESTLELHLSYGRPGKRNYSINKDLTINIPLDPTGQLNWFNRIHNDSGSAGLTDGAR